MNQTSICQLPAKGHCARYLTSLHWSPPPLCEATAITSLCNRNSRPRGAHTVNRTAEIWTSAYVIPRSFMLVLLSKNTWSFFSSQGKLVSLAYHHLYSIPLSRWFPRGVYQHHWRNSFSRCVSLPPRVLGLMATAVPRGLSDPSV